MMRFAALLGGLGMAAIAMAACGGGDETEVPPTGGFMPWFVSSTAVATTTAPTAVATTAAPTAAAAVEDRAQVEALLKAAVLRLEDLPSGFTPVGEKFITNEEVARKSSTYTGALTLEDLNRWGRILGYGASYYREASPDSPLGWVLFFSVGVQLFRDSSGAHDAVQETRRWASDLESLRAFQEEFGGSIGDVRDLSISAMSFTEVGDERAAFELKFTPHDPDIDRDLDFSARFVAIRRGRLMGNIEVIALGALGPVPELEELVASQELEDLARKLDDRLKDALE